MITAWPPGASKNYRYSTNLQVAIDASTRLVIAVGNPQPGNRNDTIDHRTSGIDQKPDGRPVMAGCLLALAHDLSPSWTTLGTKGLPARPLPADSFAAVTRYSGSDTTDELTQGVAGGTWRITALGRQVALAVQRALGDVAVEFLDRKLIETMPGRAVVPRLAELVGRLLDAGKVTGGAAFRAMAPSTSPADATAALCLASRLGALRQHRGDNARRGHGEALA